ncbi:hypothetical protein H6A12_04070 [Phocea massiliensis]|uniref:AlgX/AlgJ SGNH hydrolase-like domain-containing protein n=1 Tax=Merdimmobilis hominis TaxID=2897707 RepID=A0A938X5H3_9FIRM|nr:hypothetical protein [Merdimmobilis hominis]MBM6920333.1 hypothetical protein [Merdimmobilis hominis]
MKFIKVFMTIIFSMIILIPIVTFNFTPNTSSEIDNRMLTENPFSKESLESGVDLTATIENYVNDRIGFRDEMILGYTVLNDKLFGKMVHPNYSYGKDGYVFGAGLTTTANPYSDFHEAFADMVKEIQDYCTFRGTPFLFVLNPAKPAVLSEYIPDGINYDRSWVDQFLAALDEREVRYVDNTQTLREKTEQGEVVFNQKYDANHWNDLGAYYGTNAMLSVLQNDFSTIQLNDLSDFTVSQTLETSLPVSQFPINELVPSIDLHLDDLISKTSAFQEELQMHPSYQTFGYYQNPDKMQEGAPKALVFQGSYMNKFGYKYLANAFGEYIHIHDYQNVLDFPYYYNIFKPDCVIFEVAEYTFTNTYFDYEGMTQFNPNPPLDVMDTLEISKTEQALPTEQISVEQGTQLTKIYWNTDLYYEYVWLSLGTETYDMKETENGYEVTLLTQQYDPDAKIEIVAYDSEKFMIYQ